MGFVIDRIGGITGANQQADAAAVAGDVQGAAALKGVDEQRRQFDKIVELMSPFVTGGTSAFGEQGKIAGLQGNAAQQEAIAGIEGSPEMQALMQQGENAILQNASATGNLRGGNTQAALAQFRPEILAKLINQKYSRLGGLSQLGQASAGLQASAGQNMAGNVSDLFQQQGAAQAGGIIGKGSSRANAFGDVMSMAGTAAGFF